MTAIRGMPPGRAGRVWLRRRLEVAERGAGLLETKLRILAAEEQRFMLLVERTEQEWLSSVAEAETWMARGRLLGGQRSIRLAGPASPAHVYVDWDTTMGVQYPASAHTRLPDPPPDAPTADNSALVMTRTAYREALRRGAEHAAASAALDAVRAEVVSTRRRLRALEKRWTPRLEEARAGLAETLDEQEREDGVRMRWSARRLSAGRTQRASGADEGGNPR